MTDYGHDLSCVEDLDDEMTEIDGRMVLGQAIARRLITPRGGLIDDPNYGTDVRGYLNDDVDNATIQRLASEIAAEAIKDEQVLSATATVSVLAGVMTVAVAVVDAAGPFKLVLAIDAVDVTILKVT